jgi:ATP-dependent Zn protease
MVVEQNVQPKRWRGSLFITLALLAILMLALAYFTTPQKPREVDLFTFVGQAKQGEFDTIQQEGTTIIGLKNDEKKTQSAFIGSTSELIDTLEKGGVTVGENGVKIDVRDTSFDWFTLAISLMPVLVVFVLLFFFFRSARKKA